MRLSNVNSGELIRSKVKNHYGINTYLVISHYINKNGKDITKLLAGDYRHPIMIYSPSDREVELIKSKNGKVEFIK